MKILLQIGVIFVICLIGELISALLPVAFPASVISMILLFFCFLFRILRPAQLKESTDFLLKDMALFFVPSGVGIITVLEVVKSSLWQILLISVVSTILTFAATAYTVKFVIWLQNKLRKRGTDNA